MQESIGNYSLLFSVPKYSLSLPSGFPPNAEVCINYELSGQFSKFKEGVLQAYANNVFYPCNTEDPANLLYVGDNLVAVYTGCGDLTELSITTESSTEGVTETTTVSTSRNVLSFIIPNTATGNVTITAARVGQPPVICVYKLGVGPRPMPTPSSS
jgi:hypothetical protein